MKNKLTKEEVDALQWALFELLNIDGCDDCPHLETLQALLTANRK